MGLKESLQNLMPKVIAALGTIAIEITYHSVGISVYDPTTGSTVESNGQTIIVMGVMTEYTEDEISKSKGTVFEIASTDKKVLIPSVSISGIIPKITDNLTINLKTYNIINKNIDPAEAMWEICARA